MRVLIVEDDEKTAALLKSGLTEEGFVVDVCGNGADGLERALSGEYELVILDVMLPRLDGWKVLEQIRNENTALPIVMLTARDAVEHRVRGLASGADDYLIKPFAFSELRARMDAVLRRRTQYQSEILKFGDLTLNARTGAVERAGVHISLTTKEFQLLELLLRKQGEILSRTAILEAVWDMAFESDSNVVDVTVMRIRAKVDARSFSRKYIHTIRGRGYVLR